MAATPQYGTMIFRGLRTGRTYVKDVYVSDVSGALLRWDDGNGAGSSSSTDWTPLEPVVLTDYSQVTGTADTTKIQLTAAGIPLGDMLRYSIHLTTLSNRPALRIGFRAGLKIAAIQRA